MARMWVELDNGIHREYETAPDWIPALGQTLHDFLTEFIRQQAEGPHAKHLIYLELSGEVRDHLSRFLGRITPLQGTLGLANALGAILGYHSSRQHFTAYAPGRPGRITDPSNERTVLAFAFYATHS